MTINAYLNFAGNCREALEFYAATLGGTLENVHTYGGAPMEHDVPEESKDLIMHARLDVGGAVIMASDGPPHLYHTPQGMWVSIGIEDAAEAERIFAAFAEGGEVVMPIQETFFAVRFGMVKDKYATPWMVNCQPA